MVRIFKLFKVIFSYIITIMAAIAIKSMVEISFELECIAPLVIISIVMYIAAIIAESMHVMCTIDEIKESK